MAGVHALFLALTPAGRPALRRWRWSALLAAVLVLPFVLVAAHERQQVKFLAHRGYATPLNVLVTQWFDSVPLAILCWLLIAFAIVAGIGIGVGAGRCLLRPAERPLVVLATSWLLLPTAAVLLGNTVSPLYNMRYF